MLLKHNYLDGWLQTYIVDLRERRLPDYADMCATCSDTFTRNAFDSFIGGTCRAQSADLATWPVRWVCYVSPRFCDRCLHHQSSPRTQFTKGRLVTMATADIWQALRRCGETFSGEESTSLATLILSLRATRNTRCGHAHTHMDAPLAT
eukprot:COSAG06_NODE_411_length_16063_cov_12.216738_13_plen_149_part_00